MNGTAPGAAGPAKPGSSASTSAKIRWHLDDYNRENLAAALTVLNVDLRYDLRGCRIQIQRDGGPWERLTDHLEGRLRDELATTFRKSHTKYKSGVPFRFSDANWRIARDAYLERAAVDPFLLWLESLPPWDGRQRIGQILAEMFGASEHCELVKWASRYIFRGAVERAYNPGAKLDVMPVLIGGQGIGKTHLLSEILPARNRWGWYSDGLVLSATTKEMAEALQGRVIVEAAELAGATKADLERMKGFLTRNDDGVVRLAYRRQPEKMLRRCIIIGTSNDEHCLPNDPTGLRRFVPVTLKHGTDVEAYIAPVRDQLWAEALGWWRIQPPLPSARLPRYLLEAQRVTVEKHRSKDLVLEDAINALLKEAGALSGMSLMGIARKVQVSTSLRPLPGTKDQRRLTEALKAQGWKMRQRRPAPGHRPVRLWYPPGTSEAEP